MRGMKAGGTGPVAIIIGKAAHGKDMAGDIPGAADAGAGNTYYSCNAYSTQE